uniref:Uncharacterized protein n=1 Tax=Aegilops tauschii subsp. strangulata TaxID=200361 RepID=A0A453M4F1_AEGTS
MTHETNRIAYTQPVQQRPPHSYHNTKCAKPIYFKQCDKMQKAYLYLLHRHIQSKATLVSGPCDTTDASNVKPHDHWQTIAVHCGEII